MHILYHYPASQHARRVVSLMAQAGLDYELRHVAMHEGQHQAPWFLELNPNHQVPVLQHGDLTLYESNTMLRYLCDQHGLSDWYPPKPRDRALVDQWLDWNQCRLSPSVVDLVLNRVFMGDSGDAAAIERALCALPERLLVLDNALGAGAWLAGGDRPSIADLSVASNIFHLGLAGLRPQGPHTQRWYGAVSSLPGFQTSVAGMVDKAA